jgi:hypothetical protein
MDITKVFVFITILMANTKNPNLGTETQNTDTLHTVDPNDLISITKKEQFYKELHTVITEIEKISFHIQDVSDIYESTDTVLHYYLRKASHKLDIIVFDLREKSSADQSEKKALKKMLKKHKRSIMSAIFKLLRIYELILISAHREYEDTVKKSISELFKIDLKFVHMLKYLEQPEENVTLINSLQNDQPNASLNKETRPKDLNQLLVHGEPHNIGHASQRSVHQEMPNMFILSGLDNRTWLTFTVSQSMPVINPPLV